MAGLSVFIGKGQIPAFGELPSHPSLRYTVCMPYLTYRIVYYPTLPARHPVYTPYLARKGRGCLPARCNLYGYGLSDREGCARIADDLAEKYVGGDLAALDAAKALLVPEIITN